MLLATGLFYELYLAILKYHAFCVNRLLAINIKLIVINMLDRNWISFVSPLLFGICVITLLVVQQYQLSSTIKMWMNSKNANQLRNTAVPFIHQNDATDPATGSSDDDEGPLPGPLNLLEDGEKYLYALERPIQDCSLGNIMNFFTQLLCKKNVDICANFAIGNQRPDFFICKFFTEKLHSSVC